MAPMLAWFSEASSFASRSKRARRSGSVVESADVVYEVFPVVVVEAVGMWETRSVFQVAVGIA
jgi:hypothetical protein